MMNQEGVFTRLVELIQGRKDGETGFHRMLLEVLYEMSRIQRLRIDDLSTLTHRIIVRLQHPDHVQC